MIIKITLAAALILSFIVAFIAVCLAIYSGGKLISTAYDPHTSKAKKTAMTLMPILVITPLVQPADKKKHINRLFLSLLAAGVSLGIYELVASYIEGLK